MEKHNQDPVENINEEEVKAAQDSQEQGNSEEQEQSATDAGEEEVDVTAKLKEELESTKDKYIRLYSEFENFRKRTSKEKLDLIQSANEQLIKSLLPVADDFERAEAAIKDKESSHYEGFLLIRSKFVKVLELYGVKPMDHGKGSEFNADLHEAISQVPAPEPELKGKILDVVEKGYLLNDKVIRYAKVVVAN